MRRRRRGHGQLASSPVRAGQLSSRCSSSSEWGATFVLFRVRNVQTVELTAQQRVSASELRRPRATCDAADFRLVQPRPQRRLRQRVAPGAAHAAGAPARVRGQRQQDALRQRQRQRRKRGRICAVALRRSGHVHAAHGGARRRTSSARDRAGRSALKWRAAATSPRGRTHQHFVVWRFHACSQYPATPSFPRNAPQRLLDVRSDASAIAPPPPFATAASPASLSRLSHAQHAQRVPPAGRREKAKKDPGLPYTSYACPLTPAGSLAACPPPE